MIWSGHNIYSRVKDSGNAFIVNLLTGSADILTPEEAFMVDGLLAGHAIPDDFRATLISRGYLADPAEEQKVYRSRYLDFLDYRDEDEVQLFFVPNYSCNFACHYCYQDEYPPDGKPLTKEVTDAFFDYIREQFPSRKRYLTIFGGEPLLGSPAQKEMIRYLLQRSAEENLEVCVVTNGYTLADYIDILKLARIREIQVTLDGPGPVHDSRRFLKGGGATFEKIVNGIDLCLANNLPVNLRMVADKENIGELPALASFAIGRGWTRHDGFKTQLGRNYELHHCQSAGQRLFSRISLYEEVYRLVQAHPHILEFHQPAFSVAKFLSSNGALPDPLFDACPACKTEWAFDYTGKIYSCTATVGKPGELLGTFYPEISLSKEAVDAWESRDVTEISECRTCNLQLACGGGCGSVAKNRTGKVCTPDCRPVRELLELGFSAYFKEFQQ